MTTSLTSLPAPTWLRQLTDARAAYEELLGWPVSIQVGRRDLVVVVGGTVGAVGMPARLGAGVRQELGFTMLCGPIVADPTGSWWTFLTMPVGTLRPDVAADLAAVKVQIAPRGTCIDIPSEVSGPAIGGRRSVEPPSPNRHLHP